MSKEKFVKESRYLSFLLRHDPDSANVDMDSAGWVNVDHLISQVDDVKGHEFFSKEKIKSIVDSDSKKRYSYTEDGLDIRANQGHSIDVDIGLVPVDPPQMLYHGTSSRFVKSISENGILSQTRLFVHLSEDKDTAREVGLRHCKDDDTLVIINVFASIMNESELFYRSENGVWLAYQVPTEFLTFESPELVY